MEDPKSESTQKKPSKLEVNNVSENLQINAKYFGLGNFDSTKLTITPAKRDDKDSNHARNSTLPINQDISVLDF